MLMGTPTYMAPEQCRGARGVDDRADVYALGVILYQMLTGQPPFSASGPAEVMAMHLFDEPPPVRRHTPQLSDDLSRLVHELLRKQPAQRPPMSEVARRLGELGGIPEDYTAVVPLDLGEAAIEEELEGASTGKYVTTRVISLPTVLSSDSPLPSLPTLSSEISTPDFDPNTRRTVLPRRVWPWMLLAILAAAAFGSALRLYFWH
jgi:serine/threonine-protein kinase